LRPLHPTVIFFRKDIAMNIRVILGGGRGLLMPVVVGLLLAGGGCSSDQAPSQDAGEAADVATVPPAQLPSESTTEHSAVVAKPLSEDAAPHEIVAPPLSEEDQMLLKQFSDPSPQVRAEAAEDIEATGAALEALGRLVTTDPSPEVREAALYSLKESDDPGAVDALITALDVEDPEVLMEVIEALWFIEDRRALPHLQRMLDHPNEEVREAAEFALENIE
jgi:hypothetical protein